MRLALFTLVGSLLAAIVLAVADPRSAPTAAPEESSATEPSPTEESRQDPPPTTASSLVEPSLAIEIGDAAVMERGPVPSRVSIPALGIDAQVVPVGVDGEGQFEVPSAQTVGWYHYGPQPGDDGAAVLAAHVDYNGKAGAFFDLAKLKEGDLVTVDFDDGSVLLFRVAGQALYDKQALPAETLFRRDGQPVLHLATCGGVFDPDSRSYVGNRVVTAVPVVEPVPSAR